MTDDFRETQADNDEDDLIVVDEGSSLLFEKKE
jgi:hypothetical protein